MELLSDGHTISYRVASLLLKRVVMKHKLNKKSTAECQELFLFLDTRMKIDQKQRNPMFICCKTVNTAI